MFKFYSQHDPETKQPVSLEFSSDMFRRVEGESASKAIFKIAAHDELKKID